MRPFKYVYVNTFLSLLQALNPFSDYKLSVRTD